MPELSASGATAAVLGAYFVLCPGLGMLMYTFPIFLVRIPAWIFLGLWFLNELIVASFGLFSASANGGGVAFFAHVGGFIFSLLVARPLAQAGQPASGEQWRSTAQPRGILASPQPAKPDARTEMHIGAGSSIVSLVTNYQQ